MAQACHPRRLRRRIVNLKAALSTCEFKVSLGNLVRHCLKIKSKGKAEDIAQWWSICLAPEAEDTAQWWSTCLARTGPWVSSTALQAKAKKERSTH